MLKGRRTLLLVVLFLLTLITQTLSAAPFEKAQEIYLKPGFDLVGKSWSTLRPCGGCLWGDRLWSLSPERPTWGEKSMWSRLRVIPIWYLKPSTTPTMRFFILIQRRSCLFTPHGPTAQVLALDLWSPFSRRLQRDQSPGHRKRTSEFYRQG